MRRTMLSALTLAATALWLSGASAQESDDTKITGTVTEIDKTTNEIVIDDKTLVMPDQSGVALMPQVGAEVTAFYREEGDKNLITRIGQAQ